MWTYLSASREVAAAVTRLGPSDFLVAPTLVAPALVAPTLVAPTMKV